MRPGRSILEIHCFRMIAGSGGNRVIRGGSWNNDSDNCQSSNWNNNDPSNRNNNIGFHLVSTAPYSLQR